MSLKKIDARIATSARNRGKADAYDHETLCMILAHAVGKGAGDVSRSAMLLNALPASMRRTTIKTWLATYSPIVIEGGKAGEPFTARLSDTYKAIKDDDKRAAAWKLDEGRENPFYAIADKVPEEKDYDLAALVKMVQALGGRIKKLADDGKVPANDKGKALDLVRNLTNIAA